MDTLDVTTIGVKLKTHYIGAVVLYDLLQQHPPCNDAAILNCYNGRASREMYALRLVKHEFDEWMEFQCLGFESLIEIYIKCGIIHKVQ